MINNPNIIEEIKELQAKANKYDSLVEKIKEEHVKAKNIYSETLSPYQYGKVDVLEELLQSIK